MAKNQKMYALTLSQTKRENKSDTENELNTFR